MKLPTRFVASLGICVGLLLTGCSGGSPEPTSTEASGPAEEVAAATGGTCDATVGDATAAGEADENASKEALTTVTLSDDAAVAPTATFDAPLPVTSEVVQITDEGSGDPIADGQLITFNFLVCDMVTGVKMHSTWGTTSDANAPVTYVLSASNFGETLTQALTGATVGSRLLWGQPGVGAEESYTGSAMNGYLYVLSVQDAQTIPDAASGTAATPSDASLPAISITDGKPAVSVPDSFTDPTELVVQPLIEGDGAVVEAGQTVAVKYTGWLTDGTQFDSSWDRESPNDILMFAAGTGQVIPGWDQGVVGQKVGSRLLLVVPSELGYGEPGGGNAIPPNSTLIFVVDILTAF